MQTTPRVFLDTSAKKHAIRSRSMLRPRGNGTYEFYDFDPTSHVSDELRREIDLLSRVADIARAGGIKLLSHIEATFELMGILLIPGPGESIFAGIEIEHLRGPFEYSRIAGSMPPFIEGSAKDIQTAFFETIQDSRFLEIRQACGAYQGKGVAVRPNQIADAFHIWCAESGGATHFLTTDFKLERVVENYKKAPLKLKVVTPSGLLADIGEPAVAPLAG